MINGLPSAFSLVTKKIAEGKGRSKQEGEQKAATAALDAKGWM